jgi:hypothetical protein
MLTTVSLAAAIASIHGTECKVFVADLWRQHGAGLSLADFKALVVRAWRERLITLTRCDLTEAYGAQLQAESEIRYLSASFHFVQAQSW